MQMFAFVEKHILSNKKLNEKDLAILTACLEASKACHSLSAERKMLEDELQHKGGVSLGKLHQVFKVFTHFLDSDLKAQSLPASTYLSSDFNFSDIFTKDDEVIMTCWGNWAKKLVGTLTASVSSLQETLGPAVDWKKDLTQESSLEDVIAQADKTIMTLKGKRITSLKDQLGEAESFFGLWL